MNTTLSNSRTWINRKLTLSESQIAGKGYIAQEPIQKDELLIVQSGGCVDVGEMDNGIMQPNWYYCFQVEPNVYLCPYDNSTENADGIFKVNHSCEPNAGFSGQISLVAMRDIAPGEEITYDYVMTDVETDGEDPWIPEECTCGSQNCRGTISGNDWRMPKLQEKYAGYFSTHVAKAIKEEKS